MSPTPPSQRPVWILAGPTATGKSAVAQAIAEKTGAAILSADSMLVYSGMDIGTAKPSPSERGTVRYLGIDLATPDKPFSTGAWLSAVREQLRALPAPSPSDSALPGHGVIVAGGTGLYIRALLGGLDAPTSDAASRDHAASLLAQGGVSALQSAIRSRSEAAFDSLSDSDRINPRRLTRALEILESRDASGASNEPFRAASRQPAPRIAVLAIDPATLAARIALRISRMFADGLAEEASRLRIAYPALSVTASAAIGYAEAFAMLDGALNREQAEERIAARTRQLAKRQRTWFRHQVDAVTIDASSGDVEAIAGATLAAWRETGPHWISCGKAS